jgi:nicotinamidase-related amidase
MTAQKALQFLVSPQNDFIGRLDSESSELPNSLHVGPGGVEKLRGNGSEGASDPFVDTALRIIQGTRSAGDNVQVVLDEDWHNANSPEFAMFGRHCVKGSEGAQLVGKLEAHRWDDHVHSLRANSFNVASDTRYAALLDELCGATHPAHIRAGIMGVWTHIKVEYLAMNLLTLAPQLPGDSIGICEPLTTSPEARFHDQSIEKMQALGIRIFSDIPSYMKWLGVV